MKMSRRGQTGTASPVVVADLLRQANTLHNAGRLAEAEAAYRRILATDPAQNEALRALAVLRFQRGDAAEALRLVDLALMRDPSSAAALDHRGIFLDALGRHQDALASFDRALAAAPGDVDIEINRGNALQRLGRFGEAIESYDRAISRAKGTSAATAFNRRGTALIRSGDSAAARDSFMAALKHDPNHQDARLNCGLLLRRSGQASAALDHFDRLVALAPNRPQGHLHRGITLDLLDRTQEALAAYDRALTLDQRSSEAHAHRGHALHRLGRTAAALASYDAALALDPRRIATWVNRADVLTSLDRLDEAIEACDRALALAPREIGALVNRGNALRLQGRYYPAIESYDQALAIDPVHAGATFNRGWCRLILGDYAGGWQDYEARAALAPMVPPERALAAPLWLGGPLVGKTILLHSEQGFGDTFQFCRYARLVADRGAQVVLGVQTPLLGLLRRLAGPALVIGPGEAIPPLDFQCPLPSLPRALGTRLDTIPGGVPYITPEPALVEAWKTRLGPRTRPRVGLVWSGNAAVPNDRHRPVPLARLAPLAAFEIDLVSLHQAVRESDRASLAAFSGLRHFGDELRNFADTAALIANLDLVITIDTSVAHLAGAMGKPVWILLSAAADWRWLLNREDSPWYPTARLFRQTRLGDWPPVIRLVADALAAEGLSWGRGPSP